MMKFNDYFRSQYIEEVRTPLMRNIIRYCLEGADVPNSTEYGIEVDTKTNTVKLMLTPTHMGDRAWIKLAGSITEEAQLHEDMDSEDLTYYTMYRMTPIEGRYHRDYHYSEENPTEIQEMLTQQELKDPVLVEMLSRALEDGAYFECVDKVTGRKETVYKFTIPEEFAEYEVDDEEDE